MEKLVLIDGNSLFNRAFYATPLFTTKSGMPTNAVFGFTKLLFKIIDTVKPEYLIVAFDMKAPTFRHKMYDGYKATRKPMPEELAAQVEPLKSLLTAMNIAIYQQEGIEADDILGTLSNKFNVHSYVYTGDRDAYQLVDEKTDVYFTKRGVTDLLRLSVENFKEEVGITPPQVVDLKALMGDKSDNIPGVAGIGEKTALGLIESYGSLEGVYANIGEIKGATRLKLESGKDSAYLSYKLATIDRNCDIEIDLENCKTPHKFGGEVRQIFKDMEFASFLALDIFEKNGDTHTERIQYPENVDCLTFFDVEGVFKSNVFAVELKENGVKIYDGGRQYSLKPAEGLIFEGCIGADDYIKALESVYGNPQNTVIAFDFKAQLHILGNLGIKAECTFDDLAVIKYLTDYNAFDSDLQSLCKQYSYDYAFSAFAVAELYKTFSENLKKENMLSLYEDIEKPLVTVLYEMERAGVKVSFEMLEELSGHYKSLISEYKAKVYRGCGKEFNINSPMQLGEVLYENLHLTEVKKKNGKYTTGADVLEKLTEKSPVVGDILKFRLYQKLNSTYIEGFKPLIDRRTGVVHTTYRQTATITGRLSSSNPNLQNIPIRRNEGRELRKVFVPRDGNVFIDADYSQIELRLLAHFSECKELINAFRSGVDFHANTAAQVFNVPFEKVTPSMRSAAKAVNFGIIYGISDFGLSRDLNISVATAKEYITKYFATYGEVKEYMNANVAFAREHGYVCTLTGRKRVIPEINSSNYNLRQFGERAAMNMPLQGSSADIIKMAMIAVRNALKKEGLKSKIILQVHDELVLEAPEEEAEIAAKILKREMEGAAQLKVPLTVEVHSGKNWYEAK